MPYCAPHVELARLSIVLIHCLTVRVDILAVINGLLFSSVPHHRRTMQFSEDRTSKSLRVAVLGGGVSGLTCAFPRMKKGVDVHVYEAAVSNPKSHVCLDTEYIWQSRFGEIGAGLAVGMSGSCLLWSPMRILLLFLYRCQCDADPAKTGVYDLPVRSSRTAARRSGCHGTT